MLVFFLSLPQIRTYLRKGLSGLTFICLTEQAISEPEKTSPIHQEEKCCFVGVFLFFEGFFFLSFSSCWAFLMYLNPHGSGAVQSGWYRQQWALPWDGLSWGSSAQWQFVKLQLSPCAPVKGPRKAGVCRDSLVRTSTLYFQRKKRKKRENEEREKGKKKKKKR